MFWSQNSQQKKSVEPWLILQWWRSAQEYIPWEIVNQENPFSTHFDELRSVLIEFDDEWSLITEKKELRQVIQILLMKTHDVIEKEYRHLKKPTAQVILKATSFSPQKFSIKPFLTLPKQNKVPFLPDKEFSLPISMKMLFVESAEAQALLEKKKTDWLLSLDNNEIDAFVQKIVQLKFKTLLYSERNNKQNVLLRDILTNIDRLIFDEQMISQDYLKKVWKIPQFIFSDNQEQAALTRLLLQKSYQKQRNQLLSTFIILYEASLLKWQLSREFSEKEVEFLQGLEKENVWREEFLNHQLFGLYKKLLNRCGISFELVELYGAEIFLKRIMQTFFEFPTPEMAVSSLTSQNLYTLLVEDTVRFCVQHTRDCNVKPEKLLHSLISLIIQRVSEFQQLKTQAEIDLKEELNPIET